MHLRTIAPSPQSRTAFAAPTAVAAALLALGWAALPVQAQTAPPGETVEVVGTSPLPGQGVNRDALPYNTTVVRRAALEQAQTENATDYLARRVPGAQVNDIQGSPFQGDLTFRGYRASGLLGTAQGLSVYLDGVRINEPFGDVVNWDLVPEFSIDSMSLVPGANPAFGLNSLGGALSFTTASGRSAPGLRAEASLGSFGRKRLDVSHGGAHEGGWEHYVAVGGFDENGWRDHSAGNLGHLNAKLSHRGEVGDLVLSVLVGRSRLVGNGLVPLYTLDEDGQRTPDLGAARRSAVYTHPDITRNQVTQASVSWRQSLDDHLMLEALGYLRNSRRDAVNGDLGDGGEGNPLALFNRTGTRQSGGGFSAALSGQHGPHQWQAGASLDQASVRFQQTEQDATLDDTRGVAPLDAPIELNAQVRGSTRSLGLYATDTWKLAAGTHLTGTLRFNQARVSNQLDTADELSGELTSQARETFTYRSWNPALGLSQRLDAGVTVFANIARNNRTPTVIELGCADPDQPCRLPAGLQSDPYLKQVIATTLEGGLRFGRGSGPRGSLTLFRTDNRNDILFRSVSVAGQLGYFQNFSRTRHQGLDAEFQMRVGTVDLSASYSHLTATYQADGVLRQGERNVVIRPGTRIAGLPRQMLKLAADWSAVPGLTLGSDLQLLSSRGVSGNEDGLLEDGADTAHRQDLPGYAVLNLRASWKPVMWKGVELFARVNNAFDRRYASFGALAATAFDAQGAYTGSDTSAVFVAPGAPRSLSAGVRASF